MGEATLVLGFRGGIYLRGCGITNSTAFAGVYGYANKGGDGVKEIVIPELRL